MKWWRVVDEWEGAWSVLLVVSCGTRGWEGWEELVGGNVTAWEDFDLVEQVGLL